LAFIIYLLIVVLCAFNIANVGKRAIIALVIFRNVGELPQRN